MFKAGIVVHLFRFVVLLLVVMPPAAHAQETVALSSLVQQLLQANPDIAAASLRYQAALRRPEQEGALPDPRLSAGWMSTNFLPGGGLGEEPTANINIQLSQEFPYPGKRGLKAETARKEAENQRQMWAATVLNRVAALKAAYFELLFTYQTLELLQENQATMRELSRVAEARYAVGSAMQQDLIRSETQVAILQNEILAREQKKLSFAAEINALLNRPAGSPLGRPENVALPELQPYEVLLAEAKEKSPMLLAQQAMIESRESSVALANKEYYPDFEIMGGYYNQGSMDDMWEIQAGINLPIFQGKRDRRAEETAIQLSEARGNYRASAQMLEFKLRDAYLKAETARKLADLYSSQIVPQSKLALESSLASYETGALDFLTVLTNFTMILDYRMKTYEQQSEYLKACAQIDELAGRGQEGTL